MTTWETIETAPKDGTRILAWPCWSGPHSVEMVAWHGKRPARWVTAWRLDAVPRMPTHWMPLPEPPVSEPI